MLTKVVSREKLKLCVGLAGMNSDWRLRLKISSVMGWKGRLLDALPCGSSPHALSKLIHELIPKVFNASFFHLLRSDQSMEGLTSLNEKCSKVSCHFPSAVTWACETRWNWQKRKEGKQRPFGLVSRAETESLSCPLGVSSRESKNTEKRELQLEVQYEK